MDEGTFQPGPVKVLRDLPCYQSLCGWGDGSTVLSRGSIIYLTNIDRGSVLYFDGGRIPKPGEPRTGGILPLESLAFLERNEDVGSVELPKSE